MKKISTGIEGFDTLLYGGFPQGRTFLISGEPGTGKTIFSLQFLLEGLTNGEKCIYITIDEKPEHIIQDIMELGWNITPYLENNSLQIIDVTSYFSISNFESVDGVQVDRVITDILNYVKESGATRLAIDPIAPLVFADHPLQNIIQYIRTLIFEIEAYKKCTTLLTSYVPVGSEKVSQHGIEEFAASGIILLRLVKINNKYLRTIRVRKMRSTRIDLSEYSFDILPNRGLVLRQAL